MAPCCTMIMQRRLLNWVLKRHLPPFGINGSPFCDRGWGKEAVKNYLLDYTESRKNLREARGGRKMKVKILLVDPSEIKHNMAYIKETG